MNSFWLSVFFRSATFIRILIFAFGAGIVYGAVGLATRDCSGLTGHALRNCEPGSGVWLVVLIGLVFCGLAFSLQLDGDAEHAEMLDD